MQNITASAESLGRFPLCVDLDGTLLKTDLLFESALALARTSPMQALCMPLWLLRGRGFLKRQIASRVAIRPDTLPYRTELVSYLAEQRTLGRQIILVTASDQKLAESVAAHLGVFDVVCGSTPERNLKGVQKARFLVERFGAKQFDYIGDSEADLAIWKEARAGGIVTSSARLANAATRISPELVRFKVPKPSIKTVVTAVRVHQWVKNILIFIPLVLAHKILNLEAVWAALQAFVAFSLCASAVYLSNDLLDLEADRLHARKRNRPLASGALPMGWAFILIPSFLGIAAVLAAGLPASFGAILAGYVALTFGYSLILKQIVLVDIVLLAALYTIRILAGGAAEEVAVSQWLLAFAMFFFFSLACVKRYSELFALRVANQEHVRGRGYRASDLEQIGTFGAASGYLSILVMALYINSAEVTELYQSPTSLWLICPVLLYWMSRVWLIAHRGEMHDDPIVFALTDRVSYLVGLLAVAVVLIAL
jgi:4-hydroxybenzoate polyprenyltransferase/phosphoserine phosphatase